VVQARDHAASLQSAVSAGLPHEVTGGMGQSKADSAAESTDKRVSRPVGGIQRTPTDGRGRYVPVAYDGVRRYDQLQTLSACTR
jgi:hypothetical protein